MPPAFEVLLLNTTIPQIQAAQSGDTYVVPRDIAINATAIISANSATDALRITQTGAGNAILVEDSANPDATPFVVTATGDVGIGTSSPGSKLQVESATSTTNVKVVSALSGSLFYSAFEVARSGVSAGALMRSARNASAGGVGWEWMTTADNTAEINGTYSSRMTLDASGNLGLGVTQLSAWSGSYKALQVGSMGAFWGNASGNDIYLSTNYFFDGSQKYIDNGYATFYSQNNGAHIWFRAANNTSGAGALLSPIQAMTLDASGNLGIGATSPKKRLTVNDASSSSTTPGTNPVVWIGGGNTNVSTLSEIGFTYGGSSWSDTYAPATIGYQLTSGSGYTNGDLTFCTRSVTTDTAPTERARITSGGEFQVSSGGSVQVGGTAARATTAGTNRLDIFNGTAPVGTLTNGISIYSSSGEAYVMDAAGNATLFSPHDAETNEWIFKSKHTPTGKVLKIDVERLLKFVNDHFGLDAVHEFVEE